MISFPHILEIEPGTRLRRWQADDLDSLLEHADDPGLADGLSDRFPYPYTRADGEAFLSGRVVDFGQPVFAIEIDGRACGGIGARQAAAERAIGAELGYWIGRRYWGQGRMTRIVSVFAPWVMEVLALERLQASVLDANPASARVLQNSGFVEEGVMRSAVRKRGVVHDLRLFAITRAPSFEMQARGAGSTQRRSR